MPGSPSNDRLFETLDPTTRGFEHDGRRYLVTDTVGFVRRLPHQLVEGFAATLEETLVADVVLHVLDATAPEDRLTRWRRRRTRCSTRSARARCRGARDEQDRRRRRAASASARSRYPDALQVSALTGEGLTTCVRGSPSVSRSDSSPCGCSCRTTTERRSSELYALGAPVEEREDTPEGVRIVARLPHRELRRFAPYLVAEARKKPEPRKKVV